MAGIALVVCCMALRGMGNFNVSSLERILSARRAVADNRAGRGDRNARRTHDATGCGGIGIYAVQIVEVFVVPIGAGPIIIVERHRRFGIPDDIADIECIAAVVFPPEGFFADGFQTVLSVLDRERG